MRDVVDGRAFRIDGFNCRVDWDSEGGEGEGLDSQGTRDEAVL